MYWTMYHRSSREIKVNAIAVSERKREERREERKWKMNPNRLRSDAQIFNQRLFHLALSHITRTRNCVYK